MVTLTTAEVALLIETLEGSKSEFEELVREKEWYVTDVLDQIESSLEILRTKRT